MPCYTINTVGVDLSASVKAGAGNVFAALKELNLAPVQRGDIIQFWGGTINTTTGQAELRESMDLTAIKKAIGKQVVLSQAKRFGWHVKEVGGKLLVQKKTL